MVPSCHGTVQVTSAAVVDVVSGEIRKFAKRTRGRFVALSASGNIVATELFGPRQTRNYCLIDVRSGSSTMRSFRPADYPWTSECKGFGNEGQCLADPERLRWDGGPADRTGRRRAGSSGFAHIRPVGVLPASR